jgi:hypothetical protein
MLRWIALPHCDGPTRLTGGWSLYSVFSRKCRLSIHDLNPGDGEVDN